MNNNTSNNIKTVELNKYIDKLLNKNYCLIYKTNNELVFENNINNKRKILYLYTVPNTYEKELIIIKYKHNYDMSKEHYKIYNRYINDTVNNLIYECMDI